MSASGAPRLSAAKRAQLLAEDQQWVGKPFDVKVSPRALQANARHIALTLLDTRQEYRASTAAAFAESLINQILDQQVTEKIACSKGCSYCCKTFVSATIPEVLNLARSVRRNAERTARVLEAAKLSRKTPQPLRETYRIPCPMLENDACSEYEHRPISCRYLLSSSLPACIRILGENKAEPFQYAGDVVTIRSSVLIMLKAALTLCGLPAQHVELNQALAVALRHDDIESRWLVGEPVFADVPVDQGDQPNSQVSGLVSYFVDLLRPTI